MRWMTSWMIRGLTRGMALGLMTLALPAQAVETYDDCLALIARDPAEAERAAGLWARFGGAAPAMHCRALALVEMGAPGRAIDVLLDIAAEEPLPPPARAEILVQAGELLLEEGDAVTALVTAEQALALVGDLPAALLLRAEVRIETGDLTRAGRDLTLALDKGGPSARLLLLRAAVHQREGRIVDARADAVWATELEPENPAAWLERGRLEARLGDRPAARNSLLTAVSHDPKGKLGRAAQLRLQKMDAGID